MISFIVIGKNEGWKITKCIQSIIDTIAFNNLKLHEIIYVDSRSTDDTVARAKQFNQVSIFLLTGDINAAIARNVGAKESKGDILFFIDGDMEIRPEFLPLVYNQSQGLKTDFLSGQFVNYNYNNNDELLSKEVYFKDLTEDRMESVTGGLFLIRREAWLSVGGMKNIFKKSQDIDLGLRLNQKKIFLLRKKEIAANHHTIHYFDKNRMWKDLFNGNELYGRCLLYRHHLLNKAMYQRLLRNDYSALILIVSVFLAVFLGKIALFLPYIMLIVYKSLKHARATSQNFFALFFYYLLRDIMTILGFFTFFPHEPLTIEYKKYPAK
jgi:glycosyltransferase involved in cell wall biosynthesis